MRQHVGGETSGQFPAIGCAFLGGEVFAFFEGDCYGIIRVGIHQQIILRQEAGEQHPMPVLVGDLFHQKARGLFAIRLAVIAQLPAVGPQATAQVAGLFGQVRIGGGFVCANLSQRRPGGGFGHVTCFPDGAFQAAS